MKVLALMFRRADLSRAQFRAHYEGTHAPLAMATVMAGVSRYVRRHLTREIFGAPGFDAVVEFRYPNAAAAAALMARVQSAAGAQITADERKFMDRARNTFFAVDEVALPAGAAFAESARMVFAMIKAPAQIARANFMRRYEEEDVPALLRAVGSGAAGCVLQNRAQVGPAGAPPAFDAATQLCVSAAGAEAAAAQDAPLISWAQNLAAAGAQVLLFETSACETQIPSA